MASFPTDDTGWWQIERLETAEASKLCTCLAKHRQDDKGRAHYSLYKALSTEGKY